MYKSLHKIYEHIDEMLLCCEVHRWKPMVSVACAHRPLANSSIFSRFHEYLDNLSHPMKRQIYLNRERIIHENEEKSAS